MSSALKFESFCVDPSETWMFAGNACGQIWTVHIDSFTLATHVQAHVGIVQAIASHRLLPYIAALSTDRTVSLWLHDNGRLSPHCVIPLRTVIPTNDPEVVPFV